MQLKVVEAGYDKKENNWKFTVESINPNAFGFNIYSITEQGENNE